MVSGMQKFSTSTDDSFHSPTIIPPLAFDKPSNKKLNHPRLPISHLTSFDDMRGVPPHDCDVFGRLSNVIHVFY